MAYGYALHEPGSVPRRIDLDPVPLAEGQVRVRVHGCGLCHTDLGFAFGGVATRHPLPLVLGHEIAGVVEAGPEALVGQAVVIPAVIPCGQCADCRDGFPMICKKQIMPGNDAHGGFASHVVVPAAGLCLVPEAQGDPDRIIGPKGLTLRHLAVVADAVSTPYQAVVRAELRPGDLAVVVGLGGVGGYAAQLSRIFGAAVVGVDVDPHRRELATSLGAVACFDPKALSPRELKQAVAGAARAAGARPNRWKIFECSGVGPGQQTAYGLLVHGATLMVVGFTLEQVNLRLSNLMAFDARALGNWGCAPEHYPAIVALAREGRLDLVSDTEIRPLSTLPEAFEAARHGGAHRRVVFAPEA